MAPRFPFHPISDNDVKCRISEGCFFALGSSASFLLEKVTGENDNGTDFRLVKCIERNGSICEMGGVLDFQLKATSKWALKNDHIEYNIRSKSYNDIVTRNITGSTPLILILMCMPNAVSDRMLVLDNLLIFQRNMYWFHIDSSEYLPNENSKKLIRIPLDNLLTRDSFTELVTKYCVKSVSIS